MPTSTVTVEQPSEAVRIIRLDRPERLNAITFELVADLHDALDTVAADEIVQGGGAHRRRPRVLRGPRPEGLRHAAVGR